MIDEQYRTPSDTTVGDRAAGRLVSEAPPSDIPLIYDKKFMRGVKWAILLCTVFYLVVIVSLAAYGEAIR